MSSKYRRRQLFPDKRAQFKITLQIVAMVYFYLVLFSILTNLGQVRLVLFGEESGQAYLDAVDRLKSFVEMMWLPLVLTVVCVSLHSLLLSHRIAGPLYRLKSVLRQAKTGSLPERVSLRRRDFFHDICDELNGLCDRVRSDMKTCHELSSKLADAGEGLATEGEMTPENQARLMDLANTTQELRQVAESYQLPPVQAPVRESEMEIALEPEEIPAK